MLTTVIIDDEAPARSNLRNILRMTAQDVTLLGEADGVHSGYELIRAQRPDVVLLDIKMGDGTGFDLLNRFSTPRFHPILITAYRQFDLARQVVKLNRRYPGIDLMAKPIDPDELSESLRLSKTLKTPASPAALVREPGSGKNLINPVQKLILDTQEGCSFLPLEEIVRLQSVCGYTFFYTAGGQRELVAKNIGAFLRRLPKKNFLQPHQSHIVNQRFVTKFLKKKGGRLLLTTGDEVPVARRRRDEVLTILKRGSI